MFLLMIVTIFYVPLVLPLLLPGVEVNAWDIAKSLIVTMLIPIVLNPDVQIELPRGRPAVGAADEQGVWHRAA